MTSKIRPAFSTSCRATFQPLRTVTIHLGQKIQRSADQHRIAGQRCLAQSRRDALYRQSRASKNVGGFPGRPGAFVRRKFRNKDRTACQSTHPREHALQVLVPHAVENQSARSNAQPLQCPGQGLQGRGIVRPVQDDVRRPGDALQPSRPGYRGQCSTAGRRVRSPLFCRAKLHPSGPCPDAYETCPGWTGIFQKRKSPKNEKSMSSPK